MQRPARWVSDPDPNLKVLIPSRERHAFGFAIDHLNWAIRGRRRDELEWTWRDHPAALPCRSQTILFVFCSCTVILGRMSDPDPIITPDVSSADGEGLREQRIGSFTAMIANDDLRLFADNLPVLCWRANADGYIFWYNRRWHEYCEP